MADNAQATQTAAGDAFTAGMHARAMRHAYRNAAALVRQAPSD